MTTAVRPPIAARHLPRVPTLEEGDAASDAWGFNCGPAALCAALGLTPDEVRPHFGAEWPGYTNPTRMANAIRSAGRTFIERYRGDDPGVELLSPSPRRVSLTRIQWAGRWTAPGVPMRVRYRQTHWIAESHDDRLEFLVYDVNATSVGGWLTRAEWADQLVPWLLREAVPGANGRWWPTHVWEVNDAR